MAPRSFKNCARSMYDPADMSAEEFERYLVRVISCLDAGINRRKAVSGRSWREARRRAEEYRLFEAHRHFKPSEEVDAEGDVLPSNLPDLEPLEAPDVGGPTAKREGERSEG